MTWKIRRTKPMGLPPSWSDDDFLVLDTSVVINLIATGCGDEILRALRSPVLVVDVVAYELEGGRSKGRRDAERLTELVDAGLISIAALGEPGLLHFENLVVGAGPETLDDGEAATIAFAIETGARAFVDERKAIRLCGTRFPRVSLGCTVDLFAHQSVRGALGKAKLADAVHLALRDARMRVLPQHIDWVVKLIGDARASECPCLPNVIRHQARDRL
jgi:predicted nucleic acid-binding protein